MIARWWRSCPAMMNARARTETSCPSAASSSVGASVSLFGVRDRNEESNVAVMLAALSGLSDSLRHHPLGAAVALFLAGVATSTNPCIWPMIPITIGVINGGGGSGGEARSRGRTALLVLVYAAGLALLYATLGLVAGLSGSLFGSIGSSPWSRLVIAALLALFGLATLDVIPVPIPARRAAW